MAVRATFELNDRPATDALRRIQTQGRETQATMDELGRSIDGIFSEKNVAEVRDYSESISSLQRNSKEAFGSMSRNAKEAQYATVASLREIDSSTILLRENLDALGRERPTPTVNLNGVTEALGQLELLEERINKLSRQRATPGVSVPSAGGGGNFGRATGRSSSSGHSGGLDIPFAGNIPWPLVGGALAAAPPLVGAATGLVGSAGAAALGAGAIGVAGYGVAGTSAALAAPTAIVAIKGMKEASTALAAYQKQVMLTGPSSKAAEEKLRAYNLALQTASPGTGQFLKARTLLGEEFKAATQPGQRDITAIGTRAINLGRQLTPTIAPLSNEFLGAAREQTNNFAGFLNNDRSRSFYTEMAQEGTRDLEPAEQSLEHVVGTLENIARAARPFFHEGVMFLDHWTEGWKSSTDDIGHTREEVGGFVDQLKSWAHLGGAGFDLVRDLLAPASGSGQTMVDDLTEQLESWDRWVQENPREISNFFHESAEGTEKIASALGKIVELLWNTGRALQPILEQGANIVSLLGNAGLLTPGAAPFLLAGGRGIQNAKGKLGERVRGSSSSTTGGAPVVAGSPRSTRWGAFGTERYGATLGLNDIGTAYALERETGGRLASGLAVARSTRLGGAVESFGRGVVGSLAPYAALSFGLGAAGTRGNFLERVAGGANAATFGIFPGPANKTEEAEKGSTQAAYIAHRITSMKGLSLEQKQQRLYDALAHTVEIGTQGIGPETLSASEAKAREHSLAQYRGQYREYVEGRRGQRGEEVLGGIQQAFGTREEHGVKGAGHTAISAIEAEAKTMHGKTLREFDQMGIEWAQELAKANPKLKNVVNELAENIEGRFQRMGQQVQIIHGRIVDTSERSWSKVRQLIGTETQLAYSEANKNLTALEQRAFAILKHMGYSAGEAQSIVHEAQTGRPTKTGAAIGAEAHHHGGSATTLNNMPAGAKPNATGGRRLPMPLSGSLGDDLYIGNGEKAAGGELIANRHTERAVDRLLSPYGTSLGLMVANEGRTHSTPPREYARGGRRRGGGPVSAWRGLPPTGLHSGIEKVAGAVLGHFPGLSVTSTTSGGHVPGSLHYAGEAVDVAGDTQTMYDASQWIKTSGLYRQLTEGIHNPNLSVNDGKFVPDSYYSAVWAEHANHIHLGVAHAVAQLGKLAGGAGLAGRGGAGLGRAPQISLSAPHSGRHGIPGAAVNRAGAMEAAGLQNSINKILSRRGGGPNVAAIGGRSRTAVESQIARVLFRAGANRVGAAGIIGNAYRESGMDPGAEGTGGGGLWGFTSGAISLANLKAAGGAGWENPAFQTTFMLNHGGKGLIPSLNRAGTPELAAKIFMEQWERPGIPALSDREAGARVAFGHGYATGGRRPGFAGWFQHGGHFRVKNPTLFGAGEGGVGERVSVEPLHSPGRTGTNHFHFKVDLRGAHIGGEGDAKRLARQMAEQAADHLADLLEKGDGVAERELTG